MTRTKEQVRNSPRFNETKLKLFMVLCKSNRYLTTPMIARKCGLSTNNVSARLKRYVGQGYVWRRKINNEYCYMHLKNQGKRTCRELFIRSRMKEQVSDPRISLNLKKKIPSEYQKLHKEMSDEYKKWLE